MARRSDTSLAALLLSTRLVPADAEPLRAAEYWAVLDACATSSSTPAALLSADVADIAARLGGDGVHPRRVRSLLDRATALAFELEHLESLGIRVFASTDDEYPARLTERLGTKAPPSLHVVGSVELMAAPLLGIVGSRDVDTAGAEVARDAARAATTHGWGVVSGGARGVDRLSMQAAVEHEGHAVGLLADSLLTVTREAELRRWISRGQVCLATPYAPTAGFTTATAMGRNKLIYALAQRTLVVAADLERGGTWAGAKEALGPGYRFEVDVWTGAAAGGGNPPLVERGARPVRSVAAIWEASVESRSAAPGPADESEQLHLRV